MPLLLLLCLLLACVPAWWPASPLGLDPVGSATVALGYVVALAGSARLLAWLVRRPNWDDVGTFYGRGRLLHQFAMLGGFVAILYLFGWGQTVQTLFAWRHDEPLPASLSGQPYTWPGSELLILAPLLLAMVLSWVSFYDAERAIAQAIHGHHARRPFGGRAGYLLVHARQNLALVLVPVLLTVLVNGTRRVFPSVTEGPFGQVLLLLPMPALLVFMPWLMRALLGLRTLPAGPLRDRLSAAASRLRCRLSGVLLWDTRQGVVNAMVVGVVPWLRYILLTDRLMHELTPEEIEGVFGHEVGHVRHRHVLTYLAFLVLSVTALWGAWLLVARQLDTLPEVNEWAKNAGPAAEVWLLLPMLGGMGVYLFVVFGWLSRRCERQADVFGCRAVSCDRPDCPGHGPDTVLAADGSGLCRTGVETFISALEKVAALNGVSRGRPSFFQAWQHATIAQRVAFLGGLIDHPEKEAAFQRGAARLKWGLLGTLLAATLVLGWWIGWDQLVLP